MLIRLDYFSNWHAGKIKTVALTNFDTERLEKILENGIPVVSNQVENFLDGLWIFILSFRYAQLLLSICQVQHSIVDMRPQQRMAELCQLTGVKLITSLSPSLNPPPQCTHSYMYIYLCVCVEREMTTRGREWSEEVGIYK